MKLSDIDFDGDSEDTDSQSFRGRVNEIAETQHTDAGESGEDSDHLGAEPRGEWVNGGRLAKVASLLDDGERVHYMWRGGTIDVEGSSAGDSIFGNDRDRKSSFKGIFTAVTDERIVIAIPQFLGDDERHIPYRSVTSVDLDTGLINRRVSLQTKGQTYHIQAQGPSKDELRDAMRFIREKVEAAHQPQTVQAESEPDPTEQLQNLKELHDDGVLTDEEFEEKKAVLLDKL
ncbi:PH domain-containing protein [Halorientalis sp.]|uniref:PH domain-containing protein n=1 Tax=Halorientalis sp. TaxID=1931229 RepID=UPI00261E7940|nr:PH domain-containing protein [Halorientalis sp.]